MNRLRHAMAPRTALQCGAVRIDDPDLSAPFTRPGEIHRDLGVAASATGTLRQTHGIPERADVRSAQPSFDRRSVFS
jgi:hypothetical protein